MLSGSAGGIGASKEDEERQEEQKKKRKKRKENRTPSWHAGLGASLPRFGSEAAGLGASRLFPFPGEEATKLQDGIELRPVREGRRGPRSPCTRAASTGRLCGIAPQGEGSIAIDPIEAPADRLSILRLITCELGHHWVQEGPWDYHARAHTGRARGCLFPLNQRTRGSARAGINDKHERAARERVGWRDSYTSRPYPIKMRPVPRNLLTPPAGWPPTRADSTEKHPERKSKEKKTDL